MKPNLFVLIGVIFFFGCDNKTSDKSGKDIALQLVALERKALNAEFSLDTAYLSKIMDSTFIEISDQGVKNKREVIPAIYNNIKQRQQDSIFIDFFKFENTIVHIYENSAVIIFTVHSFGRDKNATRERQTRFYDVWINRQGEWKLVSSQGTPL